MSKSPRHAAATHRRRVRQLPGTAGPEGYSVWKEEPLTFLDSEPEPVISVTRGDEHDYAHAHPNSAELVVEIAVSSLALDRENAALYAEAGIKEYWIVIGTECQVEVYRRPENGLYQEKRLYRQDEELMCAVLPGLRLSVADLFLS